MDIKTAQEVLACLPVGKTPFYYCKDRYAVFLLSQVIGRQCAIADLKKSAYSGLLHKPLVKDVLAQGGTMTTGIQHGYRQSNGGKTNKTKMTKMTKSLSFSP